MFISRALHTNICTSCRLRAAIAAKQFARSRDVNRIDLSNRSFTTARSYREANGANASRKKVVERIEDIIEKDIGGIETGVEEHIQGTEAGIERVGDDIEAGIEEGVEVDFELPTQPPEDAALAARRVFGDALPEGFLDEEALTVYERLYGTPVRWEEEVDGIYENEGDELEVGTGVLREGEDGVLEEVEFEIDEEEDGEELIDEEIDREVEGIHGSLADLQLAEDIQSALSSQPSSALLEPSQDSEESTDSYQRTHPLTIPNRFTTNPSTLILPTTNLTDPIITLTSTHPTIHLQQTAHRLFGGPALPYSTSTPSMAKTLQQKPIPLEAGQSHMSEIEGDIFLSCLVPGIYASVMSVLVETRKRLGGAWARALVEKAQRGELRVLDAGGGGAGILALREVLRAEWEVMMEDSTDSQSSTALAEADGKLGGMVAAPPLGHATVLTGSDLLRRKASQLLHDTSFIPRLPDYVHAETAGRKGRFDLVIAPHTLWPLRESHLRKTHLLNLWNLLSQDGGVLLLIEKGVPRGFELVAGARETLLNSRIEATRSSSDNEPEIEWEDAQAEPPSPPLLVEKEKGMIIAPCTNHTSCPMYEPKGMVKGRRDICHFSQRYIRPPFLQKILGARDKNFEDVKFSYLSVMRGRDLREEQDIPGEPELQRIPVQQNAHATALAFEGYEHASDAESVPSLSLPRAVLPPLKRRGHVILDLCTPAGTLERWTVPRSFSRQAFRDARKSSWGDLWALGAKTRVPRVAKIKTRAGNADLDVELVGKGKKGGGGVGGGGVGVGEGGRVRGGRKVKGIRDKRDKMAKGNGRRKNVVD